MRGLQSYLVPMNMPTATPVMNWNIWNVRRLLDQAVSLRFCPSPTLTASSSCVHAWPFAAVWTPESLHAVWPEVEVAPLGRRARPLRRRQDNFPYGVEVAMRVLLV